MSEGITGFYQDLYKHVETQPDNEDFYDNCPELSRASSDMLDAELSQAELLAALNTCSDSAPGSDGIKYSVYKKLWSVAGPIIHDAWRFSCERGEMPPSHKESVISLLPKEGKNVKDIKNWRPITLSNCDSKIITKALALRVSKVLDEVIDKNQTAYVGGRAVADNLRSILFMKDHCREKGIDAVLVSLDARKAFDSVSHKYIRETLVKYGFGQNFVNYFNTLYKDISARVLINGFLSDKINIERGVKQGDALSCAIFILCIDPLLRNINADQDIKIVEVITRMSRQQVNYKAGGFADDINVICGGDRGSVQRIFVQYERLTKRSGLTLNADKTEILALHTEDIIEYEVEYEGVDLKIKTVDELKICGIWYCNNIIKEYNRNITEKIEKLENKIRMWNARNLTFEGKILIVKTFGISQLIYVLQVCGLNEGCSKVIEKIIFGFIWKAQGNNGARGIDRIKRSILKNKYVEGGLNVTDIECLDRSLKTRQYIRASRSKHPIHMVQLYCVEDGGNKSSVMQRYNKISTRESITMVAQSTINLLDVVIKSKLIDNFEIYSGDKIAIGYAGTINVSTYLKMSNNKLIECVYRPLLREGVETLHELVGEGEIEHDRNRLKRLKMVIQAFPIQLSDLASSFDDDTQTNNEDKIFIMGEKGNWLDLQKVTTKEMQELLKVVLNKVSSQNQEVKLGIGSFEKEDIMKFRHKCKNTKLRHIFFRLISGDIFSKERMCKFGMIDSNRCERCGQVETTRHLLWDCVESSKIWKLFNDWLENKLSLSNRMNEYSHVYMVDNDSHVCKVKMKIIQEMIQIIRPSNWNIDKIEHLSMEIIRIERYNKLKRYL